MKSKFRLVNMFKCFLASCFAVFAAITIAGCSHQSLASVLHGGEIVTSGDSQDSMVASTVDKTVTAAGVKKVIVGVGVGSIKVNAGGSDGIRAHAVRKYSGNPDANVKKLISECRVDIKTTGDSVEIKDHVPEALNRGNKVKNLRLDVELSIPAGLGLESGIGVGSTTLDGRFASVKVGSGVGDIFLKGETAGLEIGEGTGAVHIKDLRCTGDRIGVHTGTGDVELAVNQIPHGELKVDTGVGKIAVAVPSNARATAKLSTGVGNCHSDFPLNSPKRGIGDVSGRMDGPINGGGAAITLKSGVGEVALKKR